MKQQLHDMNKSVTPEQHHALCHLLTYLHRDPDAAWEAILCLHREAQSEEHSY